MGVGELIPAVTDAGPLIHLAEVGCLTLLRVFGIVHIPDAVWSETVGQARVPQADVWALSIIQRHTLPRSELERFVRENALQDLHSGECESLYLCHRVNVPILLTDDLAVRDAAKRLGLTPVGSLGIIVRAYRLGYIALIEAERHITALYDTSSLFVTRTIVELAIEQLHGHTERTR